jgi:hypothetical protein
MKTPRFDSLHRDVLAGEEAAPCRAASLEQMLVLVQHRRCRRRRRSGLWVALPAVLACAFLLLRSPAPASRFAATVTSSTGEIAGSAAPSGSRSAGDAPVRFITDEELLNLFPDRPVALVGAAGRQRFVFLDERQEVAEPSPSY